MKTLRLLAVLMLLAVPTITSSHLLGGDPTPLCSPNDPSCQTTITPPALRGM